MNTVRQTGVTPQLTIQQSASMIAIGGQAPTNPNSPPAELRPLDNVNQTAGASGRATALDLVDQNPHQAKIQELLQAQKYDELAALVNQLGIRALGQLELSYADIQKIAEGLGQSSWTNALPMLNAYTESDRQAVEALILAADINVNQKLSALKEMVGPDAVFNFVRSATPETLKPMSAANRNMVLAVLDPGNSIWSNITQGTNEAVMRRMFGESDRIEDGLASKVLRSARNEAELKDLLSKVNQFNRDDVAYRYVMDLTPQELAGMSDGTKKVLLEQLIDSGLSLPFFKVDLNSVANLDETLNMTFKQHAEAAKRIYLSMTPDAQQSQGVQELVQKSDVLMQQIQQLEHSLRSDIQSGQMTKDKIASYQQQLQTLQAQNQGNPEVQAKLQSLMSTLSQLQQGLETVAQVQQLSVSAMDATRQQLQQTQSQLATAQSQLDGLASKVTSSQQAFEAAEKQLLSQFEQVFKIQQELGQVSGDQAALLGEMQELLASNKNPQGKLARLEQLNQRLAQLEGRLTQQAGSQSQISQKFEQAKAQLAAQRQAYKQALTTLQSDQTALKGHADRLDTLLNSYQTQLNQLESSHQQARAEFEALSPDLLPKDYGNLQRELDSVRLEIDQHQAKLGQLKTTQAQTVLPGLKAIDNQSTALQQQLNRLQGQLQSAENAQDQTQELMARLTAAQAQAKAQAEELLGNARSLISSARQNIGSLNYEELGQKKAELEAMQKTLLDNASSPQQVQAEIEQLQSLAEQMAQIRGQLSTTQTLRSNLSDSVADILQRKQNAEAELTAANQAIESASQSLRSAESTVQQSEQELQQLQTQIASYETQIQNWQKELDGLQSNNTASKTSFLEAVHAQMGAGKGPNKIAKMPDTSEIGKTLSTNFASVDAQRQEIENKLKALQSTLSTTRNQLTSKQEELETQKATLQEQLNALNSAEQEAAKQRQALDTAQKDNQRVLTSVQQQISLLSGQPGSPQLQAALTELQGLQDSLGQEVTQSQQVLDHAAVQLTSLSALKQRLSDSKTALTTQNQQISDFVSGKLDTAAQNVGNTQAHFDQLKALADNVKQQMQALIAQTQSGDIDFREVLRTGAELFSQAQDSETLKLFEDFQALIMNIGTTLHEARGASRGAKELAESAFALLDDAQKIISSFNQTYAGIHGELSQMQEQVSTAHNNLLSEQRKLLEQRRQLGIQSGTYQAALARYEQLLNSQQPLTDQEQRELQGLERTLSGIEGELANQSESLKSQIEGLNQLKAQVNARVEVLNTKIRELSELRGKLVDKRSDIVENRDDLKARYADLKQQRDALAQQLQELLQKAQQFGGISNLNQMITMLRGMLGQMDAQLTDFESQIKQADELLGLIDNTVVQVDTSLASANALKSQLLLLKGELDEALELAGQLLDAVTQLLGEVQELKSNVQEAQHEIQQESGNEAPTAIPAQQTQTRSADSSSETLASQKQSQQRQGFATKLSDRMTALWNSRQRADAAKLENDHQARREALLKDFQARLNWAKGLQQQTEAQLKAQEQLEQSNALLLQQTQ